MERFLTITERYVLLDLLDMLLRRWVRIALIAGVSIGAALVYNVTNGADYTATARVLVTPGAGTLSVSGVGLEATPGAETIVVPDHGQTARNQAELLADPGLIRKLLPAMQAPVETGSVGQLGGAAMRVRHWLRNAGEAIGLVSSVSPGERFQTRLSTALKVRAVGDTDVVKLDFTWNDRAFAASTLNLVLAGYQRAIADAADARAALHAQEMRVAEAKSELDALDARLATTSVTAAPAPTAI